MYLILSIATKTSQHASQYTCRIPLIYIQSYTLVHTSRGPTHSQITYNSVFKSQISSGITKSVFKSQISASIHKISSENTNQTPTS